MKTTVKLQDIKVKAFHGFYEEEREKGNDFVINVCAQVKSFDSFEDNIHDTVNYEELNRICLEEMAKTKKLIESVAFAIITRIKNEIPNVTGGNISIAKLNPPMEGSIAAAEVKMEF